jgi:hypothetical protein
MLVDKRVAAAPRNEVAVRQEGKGVSDRDAGGDAPVAARR